MYHALLTNRYLTSRVIPFIAVAAVALCVALVIIVVSVMTGFLNMVKNSGRKLMGDVVVSYPVSGIPHYPRLIEMIEALPEADAASPVVDGVGLLKMPYPAGPDKQTSQVQFWGIEPESFARVTGYEETIFWREATPEYQELLWLDVMRQQWRHLFESLSDDQKFEIKRWVASRDRLRQLFAEDQEINWERLFISLAYQTETLKGFLTESQWNELLARDERLFKADRILQDGITLTRGPDHQPAIVLGLHVSKGNQRQKDGTYDTYDGRWWMPRYEVTLTTMPVRSGLSDPESRIFPVANEFQSGVYLIDETRVMIPIGEAQRMTHLDDGEIIDEDDPDFPVLGIDPKRATMVLVRSVEGVTPDELRDAVKIVYERFVDELQEDESAFVKPPFPLSVGIMTWLEQQANFIGPVEKERELMRTLFSMIYIVCAGLVLAIFWSIVYEKTRDIGILRSIGASRLGISWIFLRYGLFVGTFGAFAGLGIGYLVVDNINIIHHAMGDPPMWLAVVLGGAALISLIITCLKLFSGKLLPPVIGALATFVLLIMTGVVSWLIYIGGVILWDPSVYYFSVIPNEVDFPSAYITMIGAVVFSLIGAFLPAAKAADVDPVKALHYE
ncbi:MAG: ABC transporter permease [Planctomycetes bacterium]|nr:ABC transporter permease [Planctomycetota bacterium]